MLLKSLQLTVRNLRGVTRAVSHETFTNIQTKHYSRFQPRHATVVNEDELFDVNVSNTTPKRIKPRLAQRQKAKDYQKEFAHLEKEKFSRSKDGGYNEFESPDKFDEVDEANVKSDSKQVDSKKAKAKKTQNTKKSQQTQEEYVIGDKRMVYTKLEENDKIVSSIILKLKTKKGRKKKDQIILEGARFIKDAVDAGLHPEFIIFSRWEDVKKMDISFENIKFFKVPYKSIQMYSTLTTPPGIMGIFDKPAPKAIAKNALPITIICDNIRDPGNMGSILRAAAGVGCEKIVLTKGCVDFWDHKVLRSAAGAHFRVPIHGPSEWPEIKALIKNEVNVYVADNNTENLKEDLADTEEDSVEMFLEETENNAEEEIAQKSHKKRKSGRPVFVKPDLPLVPYYAVDYTQREVVLIVGGETEGISKDSYDLVQDHNGIRVNVPLNNEIDSLNAGMALGIVAFEIKRQFALIHKKLNDLPQ